MCKDNVDLPKEANKAKCFVIACFVFSLFSMIGFAGGMASPAMFVGALCGILACVASSILMCCAPKSTAEGGGKFTAAGALLLIAGIIQLIMGIVVIIQMIVVLNEVQKGWCDDYYKTCATDDSGSSCSDKSDAGSYFDKTSDSVCHRMTKTSAYSCQTKSQWDSCVDVHGGVKDAVTGIIVVLFGIVAAFHIIAGTLNTIGGGYCLKAKSAMAAKAISPA
jgi:hypothetical protein